MLETIFLKVQEKFNSYLNKNLGSYDDKLFDLIVHASLVEREVLETVYPYHVKVVTLHLNEREVTDV